MGTVMGRISMEWNGDGYGKIAMQWNGDRDGKIAMEWNGDRDGKAINGMEWDLYLLNETPWNGLKHFVTYPLL